MTKKLKNWMIFGGVVGMVALAGAGIAFTVLANQIKKNSNFNHSNSGTTSVPTPVQPEPNKPLSVKITTPNHTQVSQTTRVEGVIQGVNGQPVSYTWILQTPDHTWMVHSMTTTANINLNLTKYATQTSSYKKNGYVQFLVTLQLAGQPQTKSIQKTVLFVNSSFKLLITPKFQSTLLGETVWTGTQIQLTANLASNVASYEWQVQSANDQWTTFSTQTTAPVEQIFPTTLTYRLICHVNNEEILSQTLTLQFQNPTGPILAVNGDVPGQGVMTNLTDGSAYTLRWADTYNWTILQNPTFQWQQRSMATGNFWTNLPGATAQTYFFVANNPGYAISYRLEIASGTQTITSQSINFNNPVDFGQLTINSNETISSNGVVVNPGTIVHLFPTLQGGNLPLNDPNLQMEWQINKQGQWVNDVATPQVTVSSQNYQIEQLRLYLSLKNNFIWSDTSAVINVTFQMPTSKIQQIQTKAQTYWDQNVAKLWNEWVANNEHYLVNLIGGWAYGYELNLQTSDLTNWQVSAGTGGYLTVTATTTKPINWQGWSGQGTTQTIPTGAKIVARLPWKYAGVNVNVSKIGVVTYNFAIDPNAISDGQYSSSVQQNNSMMPFGYTVYVNGKIFNSQSEINYLKQNGYGDPTEIIPFHDFQTTPWPNNELQMNQANVNLPNFQNEG